MEQERRIIMSFQENLRYYRAKAGYKSAKEFAEVLGLPYATYAGYEYKNREPKYNTLCKIADLLNVSIDELLKGEIKMLKIADEFDKRLNGTMLAAMEVIKQICKTKNETENKCKGCPCNTATSNNFVSCQWESYPGTKPKDWTVKKRARTRGQE